MDTSRNWNAWLVCLAFASANASGQVFSHKQRGEHFEATVTADRIVVKERYKGATTVHGDLTCPLGSGVRANMLTESESKLCLTFSTDECEYTRYQNGTAIHKDELATARLPKMCIALATAKDAQRLVTLVNAGPQANGHGEAAPVELILPPPAVAETAPAELPKRVATKAVAETVPAEVPKRVATKALVEAAPAEVPKRVATKAVAAQHTQAPSGSTQTVEVRTQTYSSSQNGAPRANGAKHAQRVTPVTLFIHVRNPAQRTQAERLVKPLAAQGIRVTGIRMTGKGPAESDLRYFYNGDAEDTTQVVRALRKLGVPDVRVKHIAGLERRATPRQYELWLAPPDEPVRPPPRSRHQRASFVRG